MDNRYRIKKTNLISKHNGEKTPIWIIQEKGIFFWKDINRGDKKWLWYENDEPLFGIDSFRYFSSEQKAQECIYNLIK